MSEALEATNPGADDTSRVDQPGVVEEANAQSDDTAPTDINDWVNEGAPKPAGDEPGQGEAEPKETPADDGLEEIELSDGQKVRVPKEVALDRLRQADYTKKTQELADNRRALETEREAWQRQQAESAVALPAEHARLAFIERDIQNVAAQLDTPIDDRGLTLRTIDWPSFRAMARANPDAYGQQYRDYRAAYDAANESLADLKRSKGEAATDLKTKEDQRLQKLTEQASQALVAQREETGKILAQKIEGWSPDKATEIVKFAVEQVGVTPNEVTEMTDPRVWIVLNRAITAEARADKAEQALKQHQSAANTAKAQTVQPAAKVGGAAPNARRTTDASGDDLSTEEWIRRERDRVASKAKR